MSKSMNNGSSGKIVLTFNADKKTFTCLFGGRNIEIAAPSGGQPHKGAWTPGSLLVASVEGSVKESFMDLARRNSLVFFSYKSTAEGLSERHGEKFTFSEIRIMPEITVSSAVQAAKAVKLLKLAARSCLISKLITSKVSVCPEVKVRK